MRLKDITRFSFADHTTHESRPLHVLGLALFLTSVLLIPPTIVALIGNESVAPFIWPMVFGLIISSFLTVRYKSPPDMHPSDGIAMIFIVWVALFFFGMIPYLIYGVPFVDALFETVSGFTAVGATVLSHIQDYPSSILLWRVLTQWIGGMMIVIMFMLFMPMIVSGGRGLVSNEMSGSGSGHMFMKMRSAAQQFIMVYVTLTLAFTIILLILGVNFFDATYISMSTISTGGFMNCDDSMKNFSTVVKIAVTIFMILSASNYYLHFRMVIKKDFGVYMRSEEFRAMIIWFAFVAFISVIGVAIYGTWNEFGGSVFDGIVGVVFSIVSVGTTTGFSVIDSFSDVASLWMTLIIIMMIVGGSSGSTAGGIKISRALILMKAMLNEIRQQVHPNAVYGVRYDKAGLPDSSVRAAMVMVIMFALTVMVAILIYGLALPWNDAIYISIAVVAGNGTSQGAASISSYGALPDALKVFSCFLMFLGRMEIICVLTIFTKGFWKEYLGIHEIKRIKGRIKSVGTTAVDAGYAVGGIFRRREKSKKKADAKVPSPPDKKDGA